MTEKQHKDSLAAPDNNCCIALVSQHRAVKEIRAFVALRRRDTPYWEFVDSRLHSRSRSSKERKRATSTVELNTSWCVQ